MPKLNDSSQKVFFTNSFELIGKLNLSARTTKFCFDEDIYAGQINLFISFSLSLPSSFSPSHPSFFPLSISPSFLSFSPLYLFVSLSLFPILSFSFSFLLPISPSFYFFSFISRERENRSVSGPEAWALIFSPFPFLFSSGGNKQ